MTVPPPEAFYGTRPGAGLFQGDLFLLPASALVPRPRHGHPGPRLAAPPDEVNDLGTATEYPLWSPPPSASSVPSAGHLVRWGPVMVLSHECELEKDFNALARLLVRDGASPDEAERTAALRPDADRWVVVAPVLSPDEVLADWPAELQTAARLQTIQSNSRSGFFAIPPDSSRHLDGGIVSLNRASVVHRSLLTEQRYLRSLSDAARGALRFRLAQTFAYRDLSVVAEIEAAVGQKITKAVVRDVERKKNERKEVEVMLHLESGEILQLRGAPIPRAAQTGPSRGALAQEPDA